MTSTTFEVWAALKEGELQLMKTFDNVEDAFDHADSYRDLSDHVVVIEDSPEDD